MSTTPQNASPADPAPAPPSEGEVRSAVELLHQLQVHQVELEMQNETLRQTLVALEESRDRYANLYELSLLGYLTLSTGGQIVEANLTGAQFLGVVRSKLLGRRFECFLADDARKAWQRVFAAAMAEGDALPLDVTVGQADGASLHLQLDCLRMNAPYGTCFMRVAMTDITARKQAEKSLRESEEMFRSIFENSMDAVLLTEPAGRILAANPEAQRMFGLSEEALRGSGRQSVVDISDPRLATALAQRNRDGRFSGELTFLRRDAKAFPGEISSSVFAGKDGRVMTSMIVRDITARKEAEQALRESQERLALAQRAAQASVWDWDLVSGKVVWTDEHFRLFGLDPAEHVAGLETWRRVAHPDDLEMGEANIRAAMHEHKPLFAESRIIRPSGEVRWLNTVGDTLFDEDGRPLRMTGITLDITGRKQAELALVHHRDHLEELVAERTAELSAAEAEQRRLNRALMLLSVCNKALVRATSEQQLLDELCRLAVESGGYLMAWAGLAEHDPGKSVRPVAQSGYEEGYLDSVRISWDETRDIGRGPTGTAIRTGKTQVNPNCLTNPLMAPWREAALRRGYQASLALPLAGENEVLGSLTLYAAAPDAFGSIEVELLEELASNLAYGLQALRARHELERGRQELEKRVIERTEALADAKNRVARFAAAQQRSVEQEHRRVSREVHDQIGQVFTSIQLIVASLAPGSLPPAYESALAQAMGVATTRRITAELRPPLLDDLGLVAALEHFVQDLAKRGRLVCEVAVQDAEILGETYTLCLFRVMQEAVTNALRHAGARRLKISGGKCGEEHYVFSIEDDGCGFDPALVRPGAIGRSGMRERAALLGGECRIVSAPGQGTRIEVSLPLPGRPE